MCNDACKTYKMEVEIQENGIIRDPFGWIIGRCDDEWLELQLHHKVKTSSGEGLMNKVFSLPCSICGCNAEMVSVPLKFEEEPIVYSDDEPIMLVKRGFYIRCSNPECENHHIAYQHNEYNNYDEESRTFASVCDAALAWDAKNFDALKEHYQKLGRTW